MFTFFTTVFISNNFVYGWFVVVWLSFDLNLVLIVISTDFVNVLVGVLIINYLSAFFDAFVLPFLLC